MGRVWILIGLIALSAWADDLYQQKLKAGFKGQHRSQIDWELLDANWLDYGLWKKERMIKDEYPEWQLTLRERRLNELMGRVLECVGECRLYRGEGYANANFRSPIREGDEVLTMEDSYLWIFMLDGTMVRLSPNSAISFKEINITASEIFLHARINMGNVLWLSRDKSKLQEQVLRETDTIFLPLAFYEVAQTTHVPEDYSDLFNFVDLEKEYAVKYQKLNELIEQNNKFAEKESSAFIVLPNGTIWGQTGLRMELIVLAGDKSYVKNRSFKYLNESASEENKVASFFYRGLENREEMSLKQDQWYEIDERGRTIFPVDGKQFAIGELLTKRIPSILIARELLLQRYSQFLFDKKQDVISLARDHGYRMWDALSQEEGDLVRRLEYLKEYTRRLETTNLRMSYQLNELLRKEGAPVKESVYNSSTYQRALHNYMIKRELTENQKSDRDELNSVKNPLWKRMHAIR